MMPSTYIGRGLLFLSALLFLAGQIWGQDKGKVSRVEAIYQNSEWRIEIDTLPDPDFQGILDEISRKQAKIKIVPIEARNNLELECDSAKTAASKCYLTQDLPLKSLVLRIVAPYELETDGVYAIYISRIKFEGGSVDPLEKYSAKITMPKTPSPPEPQSPKSNFGLEKSNGGRDDSDVYLSGELTGSSGNKIQKSIDVKIEYRKHRKINRTDFEYGPKFELLASTAIDADPDSVTLGYFLSYYPRFLSIRSARQLQFRHDFKIESDRSFTNTNFLVDDRLTWRPRPKYFGGNQSCVKEGCLFFRPFIGQEVGFNLKSPVPEAESKAIYRPYLGASLTLNKVINSLGIKEAIFNVSYIRRFPLTKEVTFRKDDNDKLTAVSFGRRPKDDVKGNLILTFNDFWGLKFSY